MNKNLKGALLTLLGGVCWGLSGSMGQYLFDVKGMDVHWLVPIRLGAAGILLLVYSSLRYKSQTIAVWKGKQDRLQLLVYGLLGVSLCQYLYFRTIQLSSAAVATILQDLSPIFILLVECLRRHRKPTLNETGAIGLALVGVYLLTTHGTRGSAIPANALISGIICAFTVMIYNVVPERLLQKYPVTLLQGWAFLMGSIFFAVIFKIWTYSYTPDPVAFGGICFVVLVGNVLAFPLYMAGVHLIGPEKGILYGFSEPATAAIVTVLVFGSSFTVYDLIGFVCIFAMLALISRKQEPAA